MFLLTRQERLIVIFLAGIWLTGLGVSWIVKVSPRAERFISGEYARFELNTVTLDELLESRCVSDFLARTIIADRLKHGPFPDVASLIRVKGIGPYRYNRLKGLFFVRDAP